MPSIFRANIDLSQGHCYGPRLCLTGSTDVFVNGYSPVRQTDAYNQTHNCNDDSHNMGVALQGSTTVFINGLGVHRTGDAVTCGDKAGQGSPDVFAG